MADSSVLIPHDCLSLWNFLHLFIIKMRLLVMFSSASEPLGWALLQIQGKPPPPASPALSSGYWATHLFISFLDVAEPMQGTWSQLSRHTALPLETHMLGRN